MLKSKHALLIMLGLLILLAACSGGDKGNTNSGGSDTNAPVGNKGNNTQSAEEGEAEPEAVTLKWVMGGPGKQRDSDEVWAEFNSQLQELLPNTTVEFEVIPFAEFQERWQLIAASQEKVDLAWTGYVMPLADEVRRGAYLPLDDLIAEHAPDMLNEIPEWAFDFNRINGELYAVPNFQQMTELRIGMRTQQKYADAYLDTEEAQRVFYSRPTRALDQASYDVLSNYMEALKQDGHIQLGISDAIWSSLNTGITIAGPYVIRIDDDTYEINLLDELPEKILELEMKREWMQKGYIREDILSNTTRRQDESKEDGYIMWFHETFKDESARQTARYGFPIEVVPMEENYYVSRLDSATNVAIAQQSKHPERAIQLIDLMVTEKGKDLYNLLVYGIEGKHYNKVNDNRISLIDFGINANSSEHPYSLPKWAIGNTFNAYETDLDPQGWNAHIMDVHDNAIVHPIVGFKPQLDDIRTEIAQITAIMKEYELTEYSNRPLDEIREEKIRRIKQAGGDRVQEILQEQLNTFMRDKGVIN